MARSRHADFVTLTKPRLNSLIVVTTLATYFLGGGNELPWMQLVHTLIGTALVAAGASAFNQWWERDTDRLMRRTRSRPLADRRLHPQDGLWFAVLLTALGIADLALGVNLLTAAVAAATLVSYVLFYTPLKLRTSLSTIVGAIPGALPAVIGWTAATNTLSIEGWVLFGIVFLWQMPHFLAIAWMFRDDYAAAGIPLLPVIQPDGRTHGASGGALHGRTDSCELSADGRRSGERVLSGRRDGAGRRADRAEPRIRNDTRDAGGQAVVLRNHSLSAALVGRPAGGSLHLHRVIDYTVLPAVNATLNAISTVFLTVGWLFIRQRQVDRHRLCMLGAFTTSALFLTSYVVYHANVGSVPFTGQGVIRVVYFAILITHVVLAAAILPLALITLSRALARRFDRHRKIARWTLPLWLYVSVTGVVIYVMLYQLT